MNTCSSAAHIAARAVRPMLDGAPSPVKRGWRWRPGRRRDWVKSNIKRGGTQGSGSRRTRAPGEPASAALPRDDRAGNQISPQVLESDGSQVRSPISRPQSDLCRMASPGCPDPRLFEPDYPPTWIPGPTRQPGSRDIILVYWGMGMPVGNCGDWSSGRGVASSRRRPCPLYCVGIRAPS